MARSAAGIPPAVALTLGSALWGIATVISKAILASVPPLTFLPIQLVPSTCLLWTLVLATAAPRRRGWLPPALLGLLNPGLSYTLSMLGPAMTAASVATLLWAAEPALIVVAARLQLRETVGGRFLAATTAAASGVLLVSGIIGSGEFTGADAAGAGLVLGGVACCALYTVLSRRTAPTIDPLPAVAIQQTAALAGIAVLWPLVSSDRGMGGLAEPTRQELLGGALSGLMYCGAAFWLYLHALRFVPAVTAGIFLNLTPLFGVAAAYLFLGERLTPIQLTGGATILLSVLALLTWAPEKAGRWLFAGSRRPQDRLSTRGARH
jgi:drug/metabolite transporter (DMT)-like permease